MKKSTQTSRRAYGVLVVAIAVGIGLFFVGRQTDAAFTCTFGYMLAVLSAATGVFTYLRERRHR
jgi:hypothetical protein